MVAGRSFSPQELRLIAQLVARYPRLSRQELAATVCELLRWERPSGQLKTRECRDLLERLHQRAELCLPKKAAGRPTGAATRTPEPPATPRTPITTALATLQPLRLVIAHTPEQHTEWRSLIAHHHYLGYRTPFGAHLRYLIQSGEPAQMLGALQYSSPAWRMRARDRWIGWNEPIRKQRLQHIVNQSRFLILPWVQVKTSQATCSH